MLTRRALRTIAAAGVAALFATSCSGQEDEPQEEPAPEPSPAVVAPDGPFIRSGVFGRKAQFKAKLEVEAVERRGDRTVMLFNVTPSQGGEHSAKGAFTGGFHLVDAMGGTVLEQLPNPAHGSGDHADPEGPVEDYVPNMLGNELPENVVGGATYLMEAHFPALSEDAEAVTVLSPGTSAECSGVPVTEPDEQEEEEEPSPEEDEDDEDEDEEDSGITSGDVVDLPSVDGSLPSDIDDYTRALQTVSEQGGIQRETGRSSERLVVRTEEMFATRSGQGGDEGDGEGSEGEAAEEPGEELTATGEEEISSAVAEAVDAADPDDAGITIGVHTSGEGSEDENQQLSDTRAALIADYIGAEFEDVSADVAGFGEGRPVAIEKGDDKNEARRLNGRVELSYSVPPPEEREGGTGGEEGGEGASGGEQEPSAEPSASPSGDEGGEEAGTGPVPAPYRAEDADFVGDAHAEVGDSRYRLQVLPFYRDGRYLVANFRITNKAAERLDGETGTFPGTGFPGADFGAFSAVDPEAGVRYQGVRLGGRGHLSGDEEGRPYLDPVAYPYVVRTNTENRAWFYLPAPPEGVTSLNLDAGAFGVVEDVPIE